MSEPTTEDWQIIQFGKYKGKNFLDLLENKPSYCKWIYTQPTIMEMYPKFKELLDLKFKDNNSYYMTFGKYKNKSLKYINENDKKYINYLKFNEYVINNLDELYTELMKL